MEPLKIYVQLLFPGFCQQIFQKKNISEGILGKIDQNLFPQLADFRHQGGGGLGKSIKKKLGWKSFPDNVEWNSKKL